MPTIDIKLDPDKFPENIDVKDILKEMEDATIEALDVVADLLIPLIKQNVNVDTGAMRGSVRKEVVEDMVSVIMGGKDFINPKTGKPVDYAPAQETINPTFEPALEMVKGDIEFLIKQKIQNRLARLGIEVV